MNDYSKPIYRLNSKEYKSINGFLKALMADCGATSCTSVRPDRTIVCSIGGGIGRPARKAIATYTISKPEVGKPMVVTKVANFEGHDTEGLALYSNVVL